MTHNTASMPGMTHDMSAPLATGNQPYMVRGPVTLPERGAWQARLIVGVDSGETFVGEATLTAQDRGPSRLYLVVTGGAVVGVLLYGLIQRRRLALRLRTAR
jgi:hypothetical protein